MTNSQSEISEDQIEGHSKVVHDTKADQTEDLSACTDHPLPTIKS